MWSLLTNVEGDIKGKHTCNLGLYEDKAYKLTLNHHSGRGALSGLRAVLSCHPWGPLGRHQQLVCDQVPCGKPAPVGMTREKHRNAMLTKSEPSQDRIGSYPMSVLGSIQRNDALLEGGRQGRIYLGHLPEAGGFPKGMYLGDRQVLCP